MMNIIYTSSIKTKFNSFNDIQRKNKYLIEDTILVLKLERFNSFKFEHPLNILSIYNRL